VIADEGLPRLWRRPDAGRGGPAREIQARAEALEFTAPPERAEILCVPKTSSPSCDQAVFVDQATDAGLPSDAVPAEIDRFG
jgi:hypothetical protein